LSHSFLATKAKEVMLVIRKVDMIIEFDMVIEPCAIEEAKMVRKT